MSLKREISRSEVEALIDAAQHVLPLYGLLCDHRHETLTEEDSCCLTPEGCGFIGAFFEPKRDLEKAIKRLKD